MQAHQPHAQHDPHKSTRTQRTPPAADAGGMHSSRLASRAPRRVHAPLLAALVAALLIHHSSSSSSSTGAPSQPPGGHRRHRRCSGTLGRWCRAFHAQHPTPARLAPAFNSTCSGRCNGVGVCNAMTGLVRSLGMGRPALLCLTACGRCAAHGVLRRAGSSLLRLLRPASRAHTVRLPRGLGGRGLHHAAAAAVLQRQQHIHGARHTASGERVRCTGGGGRAAGTCGALLSPCAPRANARAVLLVRALRCVALRCWRLPEPHWPGQAGPGLEGWRLERVTLRRCACDLASALRLLLCCLELRPAPTPSTRRAELRAGCVVHPPPCTRCRQACVTTRRGCASAMVGSLGAFPRPRAARPARHPSGPDGPCRSTASLQMWGQGCCCWRVCGATCACLAGGAVSC
jgi:hypothetical protein